jgi:hypothetical protein
VEARVDEHIRIARIRRAKALRARLAEMRDRLTHELADDETRMELRDRIMRLEKRVA